MQRRRRTPRIRKVVLSRPVRKMDGTSMARSFRRSAKNVNPSETPGLPERLYSVSEAAKLLGLSAYYLRDLERTGTVIPLRTKGSHRRYTAQMVEKIAAIMGRRTVVPSGHVLIYLRTPLRPYAPYASEDLEGQRKKIDRFMRDNAAMSDMDRAQTWPVFTDHAFASDLPARSGLADLLRELNRTEAETVLVTSRYRLGIFDMGLLRAVIEASGKTLMEADPNEPIPSSEIMTEWRTMLGYLFTEVLHADVGAPGIPRQTYEHLVQTFENYVRISTSESEGA